MKFASMVWRRSRSRQRRLPPKPTTHSRILERPGAHPTHRRGDRARRARRRRLPDSVEIAHDGFAGDIIGHYVTREESAA